MEVLSIVALLDGVDRPGLVAKVAGWIFARGGNILHADQHRDAEENVFFQRVEWLQPGGASDVRGIAASFEAMARQELGMNCRATVSDEKTRVGILVLVSRIPQPSARRRRLGPQGTGSGTRRFRSSCALASRA